MHSDREQRKDPQSGPISGPVWISAFTVFLCFCGPLCANKISRCCYAAYFMSEMLGKYAEMGREFVLQMSNKSYVHHLNSIPNHPMHYLNNWKYSVDCLHRVTNFTNIFKQRVQKYGQETGVTSSQESKVSEVTCLQPSALQTSRTLSLHFLMISFKCPKLINIQ